MLPLSVVTVDGLQDASGLCGPGQHGQPHGQEPAEERLPRHRHRCFPRLLQGAAGPGRPGEQACTAASSPSSLSVCAGKKVVDCCPLQVVDSPAEVAEKADRIITMLPSSPNVIEVYTGPNGILKYAEPTSSSVLSLVCPWEESTRVSHWSCFFSDS